MDKRQDVPIPNASNERQRSSTSKDGSSSYLIARDAPNERERSSTSKDGSPSYLGICAPREHLLPPMDPVDKDKHTLVLDMDGTLLTEFTEDWFHGNNDARFCRMDFVVKRQSTGRLTFISMRPNLEEFLETMAILFEIVIFTESPQKRADAILDKLPNSSLIRYRLYRDSCTEIEGRLVKDLSLLGRDLSRVVILDDCPFSYSLQPSNAFPIKRFVGLASDSELLPNTNSVQVPLALLAIRKSNVPLTQKSTSLSDKGQYWKLPRKPLRGPLLLPMKGNEKKHTLVLDMDGTLVDYSLNVPIDNDSDSDRDSFKRPGVDKFLEEMEKIFELVIFTASTQMRANMVIDSLFDPDHKYLFSHALSREACLLCCEPGRFVKDLSLLGRDLSKVILIDDNPLSYELQPFNAIPIKTFRAGDTSDNQLTQLIPFLRQLAQEENDVRPLVRAKYHDFDCVVYAPSETPN